MYISVYFALSVYVCMWLYKQNNSTQLKTQLNEVVKNGRIVKAILRHWVIIIDTIMCALVYLLGSF